MSWIKKRCLTNDCVRDMTQQPFDYPINAEHDFLMRQRAVPQPRPMLPPPLPPPPPQMVLLDLQREWQRGFDAWFAWVWQDPNECPFEKDSLLQKRREMHNNDSMSIPFAKGMREAEIQWQHSQHAIERARTMRIEIPPSTCSVCYKKHACKTTECLDIEFRLSSLKAKAAKVPVSRSWLQDKKTWISKPSQQLPRDAAQFGRLILRDGCSVLFTEFPKYACTFDVLDVIAPKLSRENFQQNLSVVHKNTTPVVDDCWNTIVLCAQCGLKLDINRKPVLFDKRHMRYVDNDNTQTEDDDYVEDCYLVLNAILLNNKVIHPNCEPTKQQIQQPPTKKRTLDPLQKNIKSEQPSIICVY